MASLGKQDQAPSVIGRKVRRLGYVVAAVCLIYTGGWFWAAGEIEAAMTERLSAPLPGGIQAACNDLDVGGFPSLIGFTCSASGLADPGQGTQVSTGPLRLAARVYDPGTGVIEIDGPFKAELPGAGLSLSAGWDSFKASFAAGLDGLKRASAEGKTLSATISGLDPSGDVRLQIGRPEAHLRANGPDLDIAALVEAGALAGADGVAILDPFSFSADLTLAGKAGLLRGDTSGSKAVKGELRAFKVDLGNGIYGEMRGPFSIDEEGYLSGKLAVTLENVDGWEQALLKIFVWDEGNIPAIANLLRGLQKDKPSVTVNLVVDRGLITLSMIPVGAIPPL